MRRTDQSQPLDRNDSLLLVFHVLRVGLVLLSFGVPLVVSSSASYTITGSNTGGSTTATVSTTLAGFDNHSASVTIYGTPASFSSRRTSPGIAAYFTSDADGSTPAHTMRSGDTFYLQLYAHTGGYEMSSFEVLVVENPAVCQLVPASGSFSAAYTGSLQGELSGAYQTELLTRLQKEAALEAGAHLRAHL